MGWHTMLMQLTQVQKVPQKARTIFNRRMTPTPASWSARPRQTFVPQATFVSAISNFGLERSLRKKSAHSEVSTFSSFHHGGGEGWGHLLVLGIQGTSRHVLLIRYAQAGCPGSYISVRRCRGLFMVFLQLQGPLEIVVLRRNFLPVLGFRIVAMGPLSTLLKVT